MKVSELWLREWINTKLNSEELIDQIIMTGLEINKIEPVESICSSIVVGEVVKCWHHPNINNLYITQVDINSGKLLNIVCNASNCRQGIKVAVAVIGSILPGYFTAKSIKLYNISSEGVLCSFSDFGSGSCSDIIELPVDASIGADVNKYIKFHDNVIEISIPYNRSDCLGIFGIAREISLFNDAIQLNVLNIPPVTSTISDILPIKIESTDACPRYLCRIIKDVNIKASTPIWMKEKLYRCGFRSINVIVDITNYILLELGQPIHAFDKDRICGGIIVRMAKDGERIKLLNGVEVNLRTDTLVIADYNKVLAIGGVSGSEYSGINNHTKNILLECAFFNPLLIMECTRSYGIYSDASYRYERGIDPELQHKAMERTTRLLLDICGGKASHIVDFTNKKMLPQRTTITLHHNKLQRSVGCYIANSQVQNILLRLGCKVITSNKKWHIVTPSWRFDIKIEEDLVEAIVRIYGYNNIPSKPIQAHLKMITHREANLSLKRVKAMLNDRGYHEIITYSFVSPKIQRLIHPNEKALTISNPFSSEMSVMRLSLWSGLLNTIVYNKNRQQNYMRIFEVGLRFVPDKQANLGVREDLMLAGAIFGNKYEEHWDLNRHSIDFYDMKGDIESILDLTGKLSEIKFRRTQSIPALHIGQSAAIYLYNECIGFVGVVNPAITYKLNLSNCIIVFELEWHKISDRIIPQAQKISHFPKNRRDISIIVADKIPADDILAECRKVNTNHMVSIKLFDVYHGKDIADGYKSLTISLTLQDNSYTLKEKEIIDIISKYIEVLKKRFQASLRN